MSSDDDMDVVNDLLADVVLITEPPPPQWCITFASCDPIPLTIVKLCKEQDCVGGHAVLSAVFKTVVYTQFYCDGSLSRYHNGHIQRFSFSHDPTAALVLDYNAEHPTLWAEDVFTHVFHPLLYKDIEEFWRYERLPLI